jgi:hypothetical protein
MKKGLNLIQKIESKAQGLIFRFPFIKKFHRKEIENLEKIHTTEKLKLEEIIRINSSETIESDTLFGHSYQVFYHKKSTEFNKLCEKYGTDKGSLNLEEKPYPWNPHTYADYYEDKFLETRINFKNIFECGIGSNNSKYESNMSPSGIPGASLRVLRDFFPNAQIYGADIDPECVFEEERIKTGVMDQLNQSSIKKYFSSIDQVEFDLIIDDGLHTFEAAACLFENSIGYLKDGCHYIIEDVYLKDLKKFHDFFLDLNYDFNLVVLRRPDHEIADNNLIVVRKKG